MAIMIVLLSVAASQRNSVWTSKLSLWTDVAYKTPNKSRVHNSLGNCYYLLGSYVEAVQEYKIALALDKGNIEVYYNIANNLAQIGMLAEAIPYYRHFCGLAPTDYADAVQASCERIAQWDREQENR